MKGSEVEDFHAPGKNRGDTREEQHSCPNLKIIQGDTDYSLPRTSFRITPLCSTSHSQMMNLVIQIAGTFDALYSQSSEARGHLTAPAASQRPTGKPGVMS
jgi:hypothetical protein